jgi:ADP-ribose pyrophosphatase YjhB (NUDIX family)
MNDDLKQALYTIADEMRGMASVKHYFSSDPYDIERAENMMALAAKIAALVDDEHTPDEIKDIFFEQPWMRISPAVGVDAFVQNDAGEVLLIQRADNNLWALPGGLCEIGQTTAEAALKELYEEAGLRGEVVRLLGVFDNRIWGTRSKVHLNNIAYQVRCQSLDAKVGTECIDYAFFAEDALPFDRMHPGHDTRVPVCFEMLRTGAVAFDAASSHETTYSDHQRPEA